MALLPLTILSVVLASALAAPTSAAQIADTAVPVAGQDPAPKDDLTASASNSYSRWGGNQGGYAGYSSGVTGYGLLDDKYNYNNYQGGVGGYNSIGQNGYSGGSYPGYNGYSGFNKGYGYGASGLGGSGGYGASGLGGSGGYGATGLAGNGGYGGNVGYSGNGGYGGDVGYSGNGGYGGYGGNGGLTSYYGYNNPYNQGAYHLGYGYYNKRPGFGNIYNSGVTPSLVTGYRGYTR